MDRVSRDGPFTLSGNDNLFDKPAYLIDTSAFNHDGAA
jgi:hypothetical protein